jgi:uncharacterized membrane protein
MILSWHFISGDQILGCSGGSPCENVLNSRWSTLAGFIPVSAMAAGVYLAIFISNLFAGPTTEKSVRDLAWILMIVFSGAITGSAIWFIIVQKWMVKSFCPYCMTAHITGILLSFTIIYLAFKGKVFNTENVSDKNSTSNANIKSLNNMSHSKKITGLIFTGMILSVFMAVAQMSMTPKAEYKDGQAQTKLPEVDYNNVPLTGSVNAEHKVLLLFDYKCSHCQKLHYQLKETVRRFNGKLAFVICPAPLNTVCNPYIPKDNAFFKNSCELAKIGLAVWKADKSKFTEFEDWMFSFETGDKWLPRTLEETTKKAAELVGEINLNKALSDKWVGEYLETSVDIFGRTMQNGKGGIPRLVYSNKWVIPETDNAEDLINILTKSLGLPKP